MSDDYGQSVTLHGHRTGISVVKITGFEVNGDRKSIGPVLVCDDQAVTIRRDEDARLWTIVVREPYRYVRWPRIRKLFRRPTHRDALKTLIYDDELARD